MRQTALGILGAAALALSACAAPGNTAAPGSPNAPATTGSAQPAASGTASAAPSASATASATQAGPITDRPAITDQRLITMNFAGDVHFEKDKLKAVANDPNGLAPIKKYLSGADVTVVNLETAIATGGTPQAGKPFTFRAPASALTTMANAGIDVAGMANNHAADYDTAGLKETLAAQKNAPLSVIGVGATVDDAVKPYVKTVNGVSIAVLNVTPLQEETTNFHTASATQPGVAAYVQPYTSAAAKRFEQAVKDATAAYDVVVVWIHWGTEGETCATDKQIEVEKRLSALGVDVIAGGHSHRVQAGGWNGTTYVDYGLGSFTWWMVPTHPETGVLTLSIDPAKVAEKRDNGGVATSAVVTKESWNAMKIGSSGLAYVPSAAEVASMNKARDALRGCSNLSATPSR